MVDHETLRLPSDLRRRFERWIEWYWDAVPGQPLADSFDRDAFVAEGFALAVALAATSLTGVTVEFDDGSGPQAIQPSV